MKTESDTLTLSQLKREVEGWWDDADTRNAMTAADHVREAQSWLRTGEETQSEDGGGELVSSSASMASAHAAVAMALLAIQAAEIDRP
jgi:hypothetical protein